MHIIAKVEHRDKSVSNAMMAKAVAVACDRDRQLLVYDRFDYEIGGSDTLQRFKVNNGFEKILFPGISCH